MTRRLWVVAVLSLAGLAFACTSSDGATGAGGASPVITDECNPVSGAGCLVAGADCDLDHGSGFFVCFPPPNPVDVCGACDDSMTCGLNLTCLQTDAEASGSCYRYCCTAADCGPDSTCDTDVAAFLPLANPADAVGVCVVNASTHGPACSPPSTSPSGGSCVRGYGASPDGGASDGGAPGDAGAPSDGGSLDGG